MPTESPTVDTSAPASERRAKRWVLLVLVLLALAIRGRVMLSLDESLRGDPDAYRELAWNLNDQWTFGTWQKTPIGTPSRPVRSYGRFQWEMQPTAYRPPLYPVLLSVFHYLPEENAAYGLFHVLLGVGTVIAVFRLGELSGLPLVGSLVAAGLVAIDPLLVHMSVQVMNETLATFLAMWTLVALVRFTAEPSARLGAWAGALAGLCVLCRPTFLVWLGLVAVALLFCLPVARRRGVQLTGLFLLMAAMVIAPWPLRNWRQFGVPIVTTTHGGYTLLLANNASLYQWLRTGEWGSVWDAEPFHHEWDRDMETAALARSIDDPPGSRELANDRLAYQRAFETISSEPLTFAYSCLVRVGLVWSVLPHQLTPYESTTRRGLRYAVAVWYTVELALAALGLWILGRKLLRTPWIWGMLLLVSFTGVHAFYWTHMRMRAPLMGVVALLVAQALVVLAGRRRAAKSLSAAV